MDACFAALLISHGGMKSLIAVVSDPEFREIHWQLRSDVADEIGRQCVVPWAVVEAIHNLTPE